MRKLLRVWFVLFMGNNYKEHFAAGSNCKKNSILFIHSYSFLGYNKLIFTSLPIDIPLKEDYIYMGTIIIIGVMVAFLAAIFAAGYDDKPGVSKK